MGILALLVLIPVFYGWGSGVALNSALSCAGMNISEKLPCASRVGADHVTRFSIVNPKNGAVEVLPIQMQFLVDAISSAGYKAYYANALLCVELNGLWKKCEVPGGSPISFRLLPEGNYTATAYITDKTGQVHYHEADKISFSVVNTSEFKLRIAELTEKSRQKQQIPIDMDLLQWAEQDKQVETKDDEDNDIILPRSSVSSTISPTVVIGVKTTVVEGFPRRQAMRDTWANRDTLPRDVKVLFLGCEPNMAVFQNERNRRRVLRAIAKERAVYRDLLTEELGCTDSYRGLSDKVKAFMHLAVGEFPDAKFLMLVDDDVYLRVDQLAEHLRRTSQQKLYFGEVWAVKFANNQQPIRDQKSQYHLPKDQYPMRTLLPYASGPHYVLSMDGVQFISKNYWKLSSMNGLEDVSSGFWQFTMQMKARNTRDFSTLRSSMQCNDTLVSFADLSPLGIRSIHGNVNINRSFCHGFHPVIWCRPKNTVPSLEEMLQRPSPESVNDTELQLETYVDDSAPDQVTVIVSTTSNAGMKFFYFPSTESVDEFSRKLCSKVQLLFSIPCLSLAAALRHRLAKR
ncbi:Hydroxyproline O-galactosyltransferase GALT3 [Phytophthora citrophthora]|uniref:Hydroxyproline O-galactosyltransferase GALT3 n=1 Tax=Phytophthora citrophthora TaxID=4793 RepID=A0AAD9GK40_9STRA|nr:Hydroxyproline O-galactosyltransferase GALT3 [Phytophthora citrophthora]